MTETSQPSGLNFNSNKRVKVDENNDIELKHLENQVGGHDSRKPKYANTNLGVYDLGNGCILKALLPPPRGPREVKFYQEVFSPDCHDSDLLELRQFIPKFHGAEERANTSFLKLANLTTGFKKPCIMDLKMGRITYDQEATAKKIHDEDAKFPLAKKIGFKIIGLMVQNENEKKVFDKCYTQKLTEKSLISDGLGVFFSLLKDNARKPVLEGLITRLQKIEAWFSKQKKLSFIGSSVLIIYEGLYGKMPGSHLVGQDTRPVCDNEKANGNQDALLLSMSNDALVTNDKADDQVLMNGRRKRSHSNNASDENDEERCLNNKTDGRKVCEGLSGSVQNSSDIFCKSVESKVVTKSSTVEASPSDNPEGIPAFSVHIIDFAHVFPASGIDENFLFGLRNVISYLQKMSS